MALIDEALIQGVRLLARQTITSAVQTATGFPTPSPTSPSTLPASFSSTTSTSPSSTDSSTGPSPTPSGNGTGGAGGGQSSSPLLFFVALGFGVVFTNLWIIVGVKYCFRYNARNRQMRLNEDGEPINLENMPRPHRRRREKKLMTMDEVNEKFPMQQYKNWVAGRAQEGLPTRGGVSAPPSRANSVRDVEGIIPDLPSKEKSADEPRPTTSSKDSTIKADAPKDSTVKANNLPDGTAASKSDDARPATATTTSAGVIGEIPRASQGDEEEEDDEHINAALPPECISTPGDTCAICIDGLEDDDDVRGLTCGHAFHAVCLDPWLTSRRACCPLCKADYYTPKPRPPAAEPGDATTAGTVTTVTAAGDSRRITSPTVPGPTWIGIRGQGRVMIPRRFSLANQAANAQSGRWPGPNSPSADQERSFGFFGRPRPRPSTTSQSRQTSRTPASPTTLTTTQPSATTGNTATTTNTTTSQGPLASVRSALSAFRLPRRANNTSPAEATTTNNQVSPSNLEAGVRS